MTLLESVIALVILSLAAIGLLELFERTSMTAGDAQSWVTAVAYAEQGVEAVKIGDVALRALQAQRLAPGFSRRVEKSAPRNGIADVVVTVAIPRGGQYTVHRLMREDRQ